MAEGHAGPRHHDTNQSTAWGTNPKACFSPFSLVIQVLGRCATQWCNCITNWQPARLPRPVRAKVRPVEECSAACRSPAHQPRSCPVASTV